MGQVLKKCERRSGQTYIVMLEFFLDCLEHLVYKCMFMYELEKSENQQSPAIKSRAAVLTCQCSDHHAMTIGLINVTVMSHLYNDWSTLAILYVLFYLSLLYCSADHVTQMVLGN